MLTSSDQLLNILSTAIECNRSNELLWIEYLDIYSNCKQNKDYNEMCLMAIDNCITYSIIWKVSQFIIYNYLPFSLTNQIILRFLLQ